MGCGLGLWADICFMKEYWTAVKLLSAHSNDHFSLSLKFSCVTESRLPLIFTIMLWVSAGNTQMIHSVWLDTQQTLGSLIVRATSINNHIDTSLSSATRFACNLVLFLPKRSNPIFLFRPVFLWKTKCNKTLMCFFYSPERGHKGNNVGSSPSGYNSVSAFARDHYLCPVTQHTCYDHFSFHPTQVSRVNFFYTWKQQLARVCA